ncbi:MAG TPA: YigZ family protein [Propionibacteriaceae bacterium]|nr:YigZ family protein [Propionibacteriaceae bacterium]
MTLLLPRGYAGSAILEVKRSVFRADVARVDDEDAARAVVATARRTYSDARHHCSAFIVEVQAAQPVERSSDDGEPAGTGGMPILAALHGAGLVGVVCVVTRWFGGVKLGAGPLARAYGDAAGLALAQAPRVVRVSRPQWRVHVPYARLGRLVDDLSHRGLDVSPEYGADPSLLVTAEAGNDVRAVVASLTQGEGSVEAAGEVTAEVEQSSGRQEAQAAIEKRGRLD